MHPWRARLDRWFTPLARRSPLSPNAITILAFVLNATAAWLLYSRYFLLAIGFLAVGGLADAFDGIVARVQNKSSRFGDFLDHFLDRVSDALVVSGWLLGNAVRPELIVGVLVLVTLNGYIGTQIEATWRERNYDTVGRAEFVLALIVFPIVSHILMSGGWDSMALAGLRIAEWMSLLLLLVAMFGVGQRLVLATNLERRQ